ncbi:hypothetical protein ACQP3C_29890, partial [Escherichia coli]
TNSLNLIWTALTFSFTHQFCFAEQENLSKRKKKIREGNGEKAQQLRALVLVEDLGLVPSTLMAVYRHP